MSNFCPLGSSRSFARNVHNLVYFTTGASGAIVPDFLTMIKRLFNEAAKKTHVLFAFLVGVSDEELVLYQVYA